MKKKSHVIVMAVTAFLTFGTLTMTLGSKMKQHHKEKHEQCEADNTCHESYMETKKDKNNF